MKRELGLALLALVIAILSAVGCAKTVTPSPSASWGMCAEGPCYSPDRCTRVQAKYRTWGAISYGATALTGGGAFATGETEDADTRRVLGFVSAGIAVVTAVAVYLRASYADEASAFCTRKPAE